jgi:hypothetical protein
MASGAQSILPERRGQARQRPQKRRLARAVRPAQDQRLARRDGKAHAREHLCRAPGAGKIGHTQHHGPER